ncbi:MAG TPA: hypothetical protein VK471_09220 [Solirubrobacterales bacterium]|nr:hypothetical protein [Solirubrobacterales bacterium]
MFDAAGNDSGDLASEGVACRESARMHLLTFFGTALAIFFVTAAFAHASEPTSVTTRELDTGPSSELISSLPITAGGESKAVYSLQIPSIQIGETLRATGNVELTGAHSYGSAVSARLLLVTNPSETTGTEMTKWTTVTMTSSMSRLTLPINGAYNASSELGARYLKLEVKAASSEAKSGDILSVVPNSGRLAVTRYAPAAGPTSLPTDKLSHLSNLSPNRSRAFRWTPGGEWLSPAK